uniref:LRRcap domain-containing protein n=1 Tax=Caenorhabditis tropicalis TaxID=1561998 RepID=A0A1I7UMS9_9PELO
MKGVESCVQLETLFINDNVLKDKNELELLKAIPKLTHLDMAANPISTAEGYRSKVMQAAQYLISLDRQIVINHYNSNQKAMHFQIPLEERHVNTMKQTTRGLSLELIERIFDCSLFDIPNLESIDLSNNSIKTIIRRPLRSLTSLYLQNNKLTTLIPLSCPNLINLNISNNKLASCASLKPLCEFKLLETLDCRNNSVTERRVYVDFIKANVSSVNKLDDEQMSNEIEVTKRRLSRANDLMSMSRRSSMVTSSMLSWFEKEEGETLDTVKRASSFLEPSAAEVPMRPRRLEPLAGRRKTNNESNGLMLMGTK